MRDSLNLNLLYQFIDHTDDEGSTNSYYRIIRFFSEAGEVSEKALDKAYENFKFSNNTIDFVFKNLEDLGQYAVDICKATSTPEVFILSVQDYNIGLDSCNDSRTFKDIFRRYGTALENPDKLYKKNHLFKNLFK